ncbi:DUF1015 family protein [Membranicola marinus]|uniref:DUF1015 family protein n=1 Tax=Membranihabitans marinus TaxID=1227546 RepID=A0A953LB66_9BACT|nr:DUF1015 family protein [Membranihabitans marinus]MBY5958271.1 DUF1015 family protein [Membranihabitans marinus]
MKIRPIHTFQIENPFPIESGVFGQYPLTLDQGFIVFRVTKPDREPAFGFLALTYPDHPSMIRPHEKVILQKVDAKKNEAESESFLTKPVCLLYGPNKGLTEHLIEGFDPEKVLVRREQDDFLYEYTVYDDAVWADQLMSLFARQESLVIADGHHRTAAYWAMREKNDGNSGLFSAILSLDQVDVRSYHRQIHIPKGSEMDFYQLLERVYEIEEWHGGMTIKSTDQIGPEERMILMQVEKKWNRLYPRNNSALIRKGSADLLAQFEERVVGAFCSDTKSDIHDLMNFVTGRELENLPSGKNDFIFLFPPVSHEFLWDSSHRGEVLPAKSTWIEPHMPSGIIQIPNQRR